MPKKPWFLGNAGVVGSNPIGTILRIRENGKNYFNFMCIEKANSKG